MDHQTPSRDFWRHVPDSVWAPIASGSLILAAGLLGLAFRRPWLFASLGPTAFQTTEYPELKSSRIYNVFVGHLVAIGMGFAALAIMGAWNTPAVSSSHYLAPIRVWTAVIAISLTLAATMAARASHPPAASTTLLIALGPFHTAEDAVTIIVGIVIVGVLGETLRLLRLHHKARAKRAERAPAAL
jgi:uncharacterized membrane protein